MELQSALMMGIRTGCLLETHSGCRMETLKATMTATRSAGGSVATRATRSGWQTALTSASQRGRPRASQKANPTEKLRGGATAALKDCCWAPTMASQKERERECCSAAPTVSSWDCWKEAAKAELSALRLATKTVQTSDSSKEASWGCLMG